MWTRFMDMHSGGTLQEAPYQCIYIEAPRDEAMIVFYNRFGHNPERITCTCCGEDYSIREEESLEQATAFERGCDSAYFKDGKEIPESERWIRGKGIQDGVVHKYVERKGKYFFSKGYLTLEEYLKEESVLVIYDKDIKPEERMGEVPEQGYVWKD
jgi:hypothetical protein